MTSFFQNGSRGISESEIEFSQFLHNLSSMKDLNIGRICDRLEYEVRTHDPERRLKCAQLLLSEASDHIPYQVRQWALYDLLFVASYCSDKQVTTLLLDAGLNINAYDLRTNHTTLALASVMQDHAFIGLLLSRGADPFIRLNGKDTVLETYLHSASTETIKYFLDQYPTVCSQLVNQPDVFDACIHIGKPENLALLLEKFQELGIEVSLNPDILLGLAQEEDAENLKRLMSIGFKFNVFDEVVIKAFFHAIKSGNKEIVEIFLEHGMLITSDHKGNQPIHYAIKFERMDIVQLFCRYGVNINVCNEMNEHPLLIAAQTGNAEIFTFLMQFNPRLDAIDLDELIETMTLTMKIYHPEIIDMRDALILPDIKQKGIDETEICCIPETIKDTSVEECMELIKDSLQSEYVPLELIKGIIAEKHIDINQFIDKSGSLLHFAAKNNLPFAIMVLLKLGSDINLRNQTYGRTPLLLAISNKNREAALKLIECGADCEIADELEFTPVIEAVSTFGPDDRVVIALLRTGAHDHGLIFVSDN